MAIHNFKPKKYTNLLEEGSYRGKIEKIDFYEEKGYFAVDIRTDKAIFNTSFAVSNTVFNDFASDYVNEDGNFVDDELIGQKVVFAVKDGAKDANMNLRSRIVMIKAI